MIELIIGFIIGICFNNIVKLIKRCIEEYRIFTKDWKK